MYAEKFPVFLGNKSIATVRANKPEWCCNELAGAESLPTDLTLVLAIAPVIVIDEMVRGTAKWTDGIFGNGFTIAPLNRFERFGILPLIVLEKKLPVLFDKGFDDREFIHFKFLVLWRMGIIERPLLERDISADKT